MERPDTKWNAGARGDWREQTLTRSAELDALAGWQAEAGSAPDALLVALRQHTASARAAAELRPPSRWRFRSQDAEMVRALTNLAAAEATLLRLAQPEYIAAQLPEILDGVRQELPDHPIRADMERLSATAAINRVENPEPVAAALRLVREAQLQALARVRSFRSVLLAAIASVTIIALGLALMGMLWPKALPLCVTTADRAVCPTAVRPDLGDSVGRYDYVLVELVGLMAAALAAVAGLRRGRGTSTPYDLPVIVAMLGMPFGALLAVLGVLLLAGRPFGFLAPVPANSVQLLAWAAVFGLAQQLFTRPVQGRAQEILRLAEGARLRTDTAGPIASRALLPVAVGVVALATLTGAWSAWQALDSSGTAMVAYLAAGTAALVALAALVAAVLRRRDATRRAWVLAARMERANRDIRTDSSVAPQRERLIREARELRDRLIDAGDLEEAAILDREIADESAAAQS